MSQWIIVPNWDKFQHYQRGRAPIWVKNYTQLLHKDEYLELTPSARGILHGLWLAYAERRGRLSTGADLAAALHTEARATSQLVRRLNQAGLVEFSASKPLYLSTTTGDARAGDEDAAKRRAENWIKNGAAAEVPVGQLADVIAEEFKVGPEFVAELVEQVAKTR